MSYLQKRKITRKELNRMSKHLDKMARRVAKLDEGTLERARQSGLIS